MPSRQSVGPVPRRYQTAGLAAAVASVALAVQSFTLLIGVGHVQLTLEALCMTAIVLSTALLGDNNGQWDPRQPWLILLIYHVPFWIAGTWYAVFGLLDSAPSATDARLGTAMMMVSCGFAFIGLGYYFGVRCRVRGRTMRTTATVPTWNTSRLLGLTFVAYVGAWIIRYDWYQTYLWRPYIDVLRMGPPPPLIRMGATVVPQFILILLWTAVYARKRDRRLLMCAVALTGFEILWGFVYGVMKALIVLPLFTPVVPHMMLKGRVRWKPLAMSVGGLLLIAYPFVNAVRARYFVALGPTRPQATLAILQDPSRLVSMEAIAPSFDKALARVSGIGSLCEILRLEENNALDIDGEFYKRAILGLVPRALWEEKPILHEGVYFSAYLNGRRGIDTIDPSKVVGSVALTLLGSFYWNLGWLGLVTSCLALGLFSGVTYRFLQRHGSFRASTVIYYGVILAILDTTENEVVRIPANLLAGLAMAWCVNRVLASSAMLQNRRPARIDSERLQIGGPGPVDGRRMPPAAFRHEIRSGR